MNICNFIYLDSPNSQYLYCLFERQNEYFQMMLLRRIFLSNYIMPYLLGNYSMVSDKNKYLYENNESGP